MRSYFCFRAATVADWQSLRHRPLQANLLPYLVGSGKQRLNFGDIDGEAASVKVCLARLVGRWPRCVDTGKIYSDSLGNGVYSRFLLERYPDMQVPSALLTPTSLLSKSNSELALFIRSRGVQIPKGVAKIQELSKLIHHLDMQHPHPFIVHYPDLLRESFTLEGDAQSVLGTRKRQINSGSIPKVTKKQKTAEWEDAWGCLGSTGGTWITDHIRLSLLVPELATSVLETWFHETWSPLFPGEGFVPRALQKGMINTKQRAASIGLQFMDVPNTDRVLVRADVSHSFKSEQKGPLHVCLEVPSYSILRPWRVYNFTRAACMRVCVVPSRAQPGP
jgi:hypothetical protein